MNISPALSSSLALYLSRLQADPSKSSKSSSSSTSSASSSSSKSGATNTSPTNSSGSSNTSQSNTKSPTSSGSAQSGSATKAKSDPVTASVQALGKKVDVLKKRIATASPSEARTLSRELDKIATQLQSVTAAAVRKAAGQTASKPGSGQNGNSNTNTNTQELIGTLATVSTKLKQAVGQLRARQPHAGASVTLSLRSAERSANYVIARTASIRPTPTPSNSAAAAYAGGTSSNTGSVINTRA